MELGKEIFAESVGEVIGNALVSFVNEVIQAIESGFNAMKALIVERTLTYEEVMRYFIQHKGDSPAIAKGALLKTQDTEGKYLIVQCFLDKENALVCSETGAPLGVKMKASALDAELLTAFKGKNLVIVE